MDVNGITDCYCRSRPINLFVFLITIDNYENRKKGARDIELNCRQCHEKKRENFRTTRPALECPLNRLWEQGKKKDVQENLDAEER